VVDHTHVFSHLKLLCCQSSMNQHFCQIESTRHASIVIQKFLAALPSQMLQNLLVVMLINHFAWKKELLVNSACTVRNVLQHT
jgi:hypothetical protein